MRTFCIALVLLAGGAGIALSDDTGPQPGQVGISCSPTITVEVEGKTYKHTECTPLFVAPPLQGHEQIPVRWQGHIPADKLKPEPTTQAQALPK